MGTTASKDDDEVNFTLKKISSGGVPSKKSKKDRKTQALADKLAKFDTTVSRNSNDSIRTNSTAPISAEADDKGESNSVTNNFVSDESVSVNIAMADLMAYLQVVANNSTNLPLTRRDDPELGRTVSTLTGDEYAKKAAAFLPCDVKVIAGSFQGYNRVWDLPSSEDYNPMDAVQEPGATYGGGCCNSMLKVLYDTEGDTSDVMRQDEFMNPDNLFADDESASMANVPTRSFESLQMGESAHASDISWAELLRNMKIEMTNAGYQQAPTISSSRKIDLNTSFKLVPEGFDSTRNKKRSLLIGCNYENHSEATLKSCHDDIRSVKDYIVNVHGFSESNDLMTVLLDDDNHKPPTHHNIVEALKSLSEKSKPGDAIFLQFTGHGSRVLDIAVGSEAECYDEILLPSDYRTSGFIRDTLIFKTLLAPMCHGAHMTILLDSSDTGVMVDLPYAWSTRGDKPDTLAKVSLNDDFSFLRFLKVVKSMYEMSTFTRLGKTVNSALDKKRGSSAGETVIPEDEDDESAAAGSLITVDENSKSTQNNKESTTKNESLFKTLTSCYNTEIKENIDNSNTKNVQSKANGSLFQKVLSCGLLNNNAASDDEVLFNQVNSVSLDEDDMDTFDGRTVGSDDGTLETTFTEDFNDRNRRRRNNGYCA